MELAPAFRDILLRLCQAISEGHGDAFDEMVSLSEPTDFTRTDPEERWQGPAEFRDVVRQHASLGFSNAEALGVDFPI